MKTLFSSTSLLVTLATATVVAAGVFASGQSFDAAVLGSIFLAAGVAGWTFRQYSHEPKPLLAAPAIVRLPARRECAASPTCPALQLAA
jgi:hypothetical protein